MPAALDRCVVGVKAKIAAGKLPKDSNPWAICRASMGSDREIKRKSHVAAIIEGRRKKRA